MDKFNWTVTHWLRYSEKMRLGEVPGSVVMPPMLEEYAIPIDMALHIIRSCFLLLVAPCAGTGTLNTIMIDYSLTLLTDNILKIKTHTMKQSCV